MRPEDVSAKVSSTVATLTDTPTQKSPAKRLAKQRQERILQMARWIVVVVILVNLAGLGAVWGLNTYSISRHAARDLTVRLAAIQTALQQPDLYSTTNFTLLQAQLAPAISDLNDLDSIIPLRGSIGSTQIERLHHGLLMCRDFLQAVQGLIQSSLIIQPHLQAFMLSAIGGANIAQQQPLLTLDEIHQAQRQLNSGLASFQSAQNERMLMGPLPIKNAFGIQAAGVNVLATYFATFADQFSLAFTSASAVLDNLFLLLGVQRPGHLLLALADPDQLRPSGGAIGAYADVETIDGLATTGTVFHDISQLDCPKACTNNAIPSQYSWYPAPKGNWGVRDSGLDPQFQQSGTLMHDLYFAETNISVDGIMQFTPTLLQQILQVIGPVAVPGIHLTVSAKNLPQTLEREHQKALELAQTKASAAIPTYDELFANSIVAALAHANMNQLHQIGIDMVHDLMTKDVQLSTIYGRIESQVRQLSADGSLNTPHDDRVAVVDANLGQNFTSASVTEHISDRITLDKTGTAKHAMTITYAYPTAPTLAAAGNVFDDLAQVLLPAHVTATSMSGCKAVNITVPDSTILACRVHLVQGSSVSLHLTWVTPIPSSSHTYRLLVQRQAGAVQDVSISVSAANGGHVTSTTTGAREVKGGVIWDRSPLLNDEELFVTKM